MNDAPNPGPGFETGCISHTGKVRKANEDNFLLRPEIGLWAVADGMGGHENGALASATVVAALEAVEAAGSAPDLLAMLEGSVLKANAELRAEIDRRGATMGATLVCLLIHRRHFACLWSGDSRVYLIRGGRIVQVSRDHTEVQDMVDRGLLTPEEAKRSPRRHVITHAIGAHETPELDLENGEIADGDAFLLCSDGLTEHVVESEILAAVEAGGAQAACDALLALTLERGARDNVTVVVVRYRQGASERTRWMPNRPERGSSTP
ncbi:protein phosphatase 2C domain-containing protein [Bosea sp. (in: a-proteobacteria)]|uniref:PP2C family protein-serine/threonine phosphatase n=1 Tax=Bosea sp. (in: a-proteobacteria) TaxID=1871050 RepID=UPI0026242681|nr:protein phosphatase 2C domain-containing protein [Bosea sp. (in: a-proteobacteria)]MCO5093528.1 protein phosphatase 2C domain-containing protein [Bosea sp. (in: a-proteobacteria)]